MARRFNEKDHPRHPRGSDDGGRFREKGSVPTPRKPKAGDSDFNKRQKKRAAAKKAAPAKKAPTKKAAPPKKAAPTKRVMLEQSADLSDLPEEQRPAYQAVLRAAATRGVHTTGDKDRDRMIRNLVAEGFLESDGKGGFGVTEKGFKATGERKAFGQHAWAERIDADIQAKRIEMQPAGSGRGPLRGAGVSIVNNDDEDVTDPTEARAAISDALGYPYDGPLEPGGFDGAWIIDLPEQQADDLLESGFWGIENPNWSVEAEWDEGMAGGDPRGASSSPEAWGSRVEELLADQELVGEIDFNDFANFPNPEDYVQYLIDNGMTQPLEDLF